MKEAENIARAGALEKQLSALIRLQENGGQRPQNIIPPSPSPSPSPFPSRSPSPFPSPSPSLKVSKEYSGELLVIQEDESLRGSSDGAHGHSKAIEEDQGPARNLRSRRADLNSQQDRSVPLRLAQKSVSEKPDNQVLEDVLFWGGSDLENHKVYSQKELDQAKRVLRRAFVEFFRVLGMLSNFRYTDRGAEGVDCIYLRYVLATKCSV